MQILIRAYFQIHFWIWLKPNPKVCLPSYKIIPPAQMWTNKGISDSKNTWIASGVVEGACRHVVKDRLERTGMSWTPTGAQALLHLRAIATSQQWKSYDQYRVVQETERLYPYRSRLNALEWPLAA